MVAGALAKLPVIPAPTGSRFQPVDAAEVAGRMAELVNSYLSAAGKRRPLVPVHIPGQAARALRAGANLAPDRAVGKRTWEEFLAAPRAAGRRLRSASALGGPAGARRPNRRSPLIYEAHPVTQLRCSA